MAYRIFIGIIALLCIYMAYSSVSLFMLKSSVEKSYAGNVIDSPHADMTVVEFFDYSCVTCRDFYPILMRAVERDGRVKLVLHPIVSDESGTGKMPARLVIAAGRQGQFQKAHEHLMENYRVVDEAYIENFASALGLDVQRLKSDMDDPDTDAALEDNIRHLVILGSVSIPTLLVNGKILYTPREEGITSDTVLSVFDQARGL